MRLGFHGATSMTSNLETDVQATAHAGFKALELWAGKIDKYLEDHSLEDFKTLLVDNGVAAMSINSIEFITFRGDEYPKIRARCRDLCQMAQAIDCPTIIVVPSPTPSYQTTWLDDICQRLKNAATMATARLSYSGRNIGNGTPTNWPCRHGIRR